MGQCISMSGGSRAHLSGSGEDGDVYSFRRFRAQWGSSTSFSDALCGARTDSEPTTPAPDDRSALPNESSGDASAELHAEDSASNATHEVSVPQHQYIEHSAVPLGQIPSPELLRRLLDNLGVDIAPSSTNNSASKHASANWNPAADSSSSVPPLNTTTTTSSSTGESVINVEKLHRELHEGLSSLCVLSDDTFDMLLTELNLCEAKNTSNADLFMHSETTSNEASPPSISGRARHASIEFPLLSSLPFEDGTSRRHSPQSGRLSEKSNRSGDLRRLANTKRRSVEVRGDAENRSNRNRLASIDVPHPPPSSFGKRGHALPSPIEWLSQSTATAEIAEDQSSPVVRCFPCRRSRRTRQDPTSEKIQPHQEKEHSQSATPQVPTSMPQRESCAANGNGKLQPSDPQMPQDGWQLQGANERKMSVVDAALQRDNDETLKRTAGLIKRLANVDVVKRRVSYVEAEIWSGDSLLLEHVRVRMTPPSYFEDSTSFPSLARAITAFSPGQSQYRHGLSTWDAVGMASDGASAQQNQQKLQGSSSLPGKQSKAPISQPPFAMNLPANLSSAAPPQWSRHGTDGMTAGQQEDKEYESWTIAEEEVNRLLQGKLLQDESVMTGIHRIVLQALNMSQHMLSVDTSTIRRNPADSSFSSEFPTLMTECVKYKARAHLSVPETSPKPGLRFQTREEERRFHSSRPIIVEHHWIWCDERVWEAIQRRTFSVNNSSLSAHAHYITSTCSIGKLPDEQI